MIRRTFSRALVIMNLILAADLCHAASDGASDMLVIRWVGNKGRAPLLTREAYESDAVKVPKQVRFWLGVTGPVRWLLVPVRQSGEFRFGGKTWRIGDADWERSVTTHAMTLLADPASRLESATPTVTLLKDFPKRYVVINGQVGAEVFHRLCDDDLRLGQLVKDAGGFGSFAAKEIVILRMREAVVVSLSSPEWSNERVFPGDVVFVGTYELM